MKRRPRLSLRARLLAALLAVTAAFLVVLGVIASVLFGRHINGLFDDELRVSARRSVTWLQSDSDYYAVYYLILSRHSGVITSSAPESGELLTYLNTQVAHWKPRHGGFGVPQYTPFTLKLAAGTTLRAEWHVAKEPKLGQGKAVLLVAQAPADRKGPLGSIILAEVITGVVLLGVLALCGPWIIRRGLAPLDRMATTADGITSRGDLTARMPDPGDRAETGRLSAAINTMLDRIQQAFNARLASEQKVRQFAADASHELRTPLTTIRGYAELYRQGALGPDRLPDAMRRIEQESDRMSRLVAELLELARLDRTSSLDLTETDLALLVRDAVADAMAVEPDRPVYAEAPPHLLAVVDEPRIRQILANLLGNVRAYTPRTTPTAVRLGRTGDLAVIEVADSGPGMSVEDAARAFDRFHRGSGESGGQSGPDRAGSGLGLSIVQAIARAHGGQATLESVPGRGTRVRIWLPAGTTAALPATAPPG